MTEQLKYSIMLLVKRQENHHKTDVVLTHDLPLHGTAFQCKSAEEAIQFIEQYDENPHLETFERYEVEVRYANGDFIKANFQDKTKALAFIRTNQLSINL